MSRLRATLHSIDSSHILLFLILFLALALRLWGIRFGLPNILCRPDEMALVNKAMAMGTGDLNPHFFNYPSFSFYVLAVVYGIFFVFGRLAGLFNSISDFQRSFFVDPSSFYLLGRVLVAVLGAASVIAVYQIAKNLENRRAGIIAAFFFSVAYLHVRDSHFLTVDVPSTFLMLVSGTYLSKYLILPRLTKLTFCSAFLGLAASTKYNLGIFGFWPLLAPWLVQRETLTTRERVTHTLLSTVIMGTAFIAASPFIALDFNSFWRDLSFEMAHFSEGHGMDLQSDWAYHLTFTLWHGVGWPLLLVGLLGYLFLVVGRRPRDLPFLVGAVIYYAVASSGKTVFARYMLPLVPLLTIFAAIAVHRFFGRWHYSALAIASILLAIPSISSDVQSNSLLTREDTRLGAAQWIRANIPSGDRIAMEGAHFGYPQVHRSREWLLEELEDYKADGRDGRRLIRMLEDEQYPPEPNYYVLELRQLGNPPLRAQRETYTLAMLRNESVDWVVVQDHPISEARTNLGFREALTANAELRADFNPFRSDASRPLYDPIDAYYTPYAGFAGVQQPGPRLKIYKLLTSPKHPPTGL